MTDILRRNRYVENRVLIETARILDPQFKSTVLCVSGAQLEVLRNLMAYLNRRTTFASEYLDRYYLSPTVNEWDSLLAIVADLEEKLMLIYVDDYVCVRHKVAAGVPGGTFSSGAWRTRPVNDEQADASSICSIASNQITLQAGTYTCSVHATAYRVDRHQLRLYNVSDSAVLLTGTSEMAYSVYPSATRTFLSGLFALDAQKVLTIQHRCETTNTDNGFGAPGSFGDEVYLIAEFWRTIG